MLQRIKTYLDFKGIGVSTFEKAIGMSNASFGKSLRTGGTIGADKLEKIFSVYKDLNPDYVIMNKGPMIRPKKEYSSKPGDNTNEPEEKYYTCPHCLEKDKLIESLEKQNASLSKQIEAQNKQLDAQSQQIDKLINKLTGAPDTRNEKREAS